MECQAVQRWGAIRTTPAECQAVQRWGAIRITPVECQAVHRLESTAMEETAGDIISLVMVIIEGQILTITTIQQNN